MTDKIVFFDPRRPTAKSLLTTCYKLNEAHPSWEFEVCETDDGLGWIFAEHSPTGTAFNASWRDGTWCVLSPEGRVVIPRSPDAITALEQAMATL